MGYVADGDGARTDRVATVPGRGGAGTAATAATGVVTTVSLRGAIRTSTSSERDAFALPLPLPPATTLLACDGPAPQYK